MINENIIFLYKPYKKYGYKRVTAKCRKKTETTIN